MGACIPAVIRRAYNDKKARAIQNQLQGEVGKSKKKTGKKIKGLKKQVEAIEAEYAKVLCNKTLSSADKMTKLKELRKDKKALTNQIAVQRVAHNAVASMGSHVDSVEALSNVQRVTTELQRLAKAKGLKDGDILRIGSDAASMTQSMLQVNESLLGVAKTSGEAIEEDEDDEELERTIATEIEEAMLNNAPDVPVGRPNVNRRRQNDYDQMADDSKYSEEEEEGEENELGGSGQEIRSKGRQTTRRSNIGRHRGYPDGDTY